MRTHYTDPAPLSPDDDQEPRFRQSGFKDDIAREIEFKRRRDRAAKRREDNENDS